MTTFEELKKMNQSQLAKELDTARKSLFDIRYQVINKQSKGTSEVKKWRKSVAQIMTLLNGKSASKDTQALEETAKVLQNTAAEKEVAKKVAPKAKKPLPRKTATKVKAKAA